METSRIIKQYADAVCPNPQTIFGIRLKPFSLAHVILMKKYNLPWVSDKSETPSIWALIFGTFICSQTWNEFEVWINDLNEWEKTDKNGKPLHFFKYHYTSFIKKHTFFFRHFKWSHKYYYYKWENDVRDFTFDLAKKSGKAESFNIMEYIVTFANYIKEGSKYPLFFLNERKGDKNNSAEENPDAWIENTLVTLVSKMNYTREEALNAPLSQALFDYLKYSEENDAITFGSGYEDIQRELELNKNMNKGNL